MIYEITAPNRTYGRRLYGVQFVNGRGETENERAAQWFSGRKGFSVKMKKKEEKASEPESVTNDERPLSEEETKADSKSKSKRTK